MNKNVVTDEHVSYTPLECTLVWESKNTHVAHLAKRSEAQEEQISWYRG